jgi:hypothetical protein
MTRLTNNNGARVIRNHTPEELAILRTQVENARDEFLIQRPRMRLANTGGTLIQNGGPELGTHSPIAVATHLNFSENIRSFTHPRNEAELLSQGLLQRVQTDQFLDSVHFQQEEIQIHTPLSPTTQTQHGQQDHYTLLDGHLASELGLETSVVYTGEQLLDHLSEHDPSVWELINTAIGEGRATKETRSTDPFALREVSSQDHAEITRIRSAIHNQLAELNRQYRTPIFVDPESHGGLMLHTDFRQRSVLIALVNAILDHREADFISRMVKMATLLDQQNQGARQDFIEVFSYLYVTQFFPSRGVMVNYLHYLLRCGQISSSLSSHWF